MQALKDATMENTPEFFFDKGRHYEAKVLYVFAANTSYVTLAIVHAGNCVKINGWRGRACREMNLEEGNYISVRFHEWQNGHGAVAVFEIIIGSDDVSRQREYISQLGGRSSILPSRTF